MLPEVSDPPRHRLARPRLFACSIVLLAASCGAASSGDVHNLLLVTFDTTRVDHLGCTGRPEAHTPTLDGLAASGVLFETCITPAPITLPSHASLLSGLEPFHHGARNNGTHTLPDKVDTLAEVLSRAGFETGAVISAVVLDSRHGLDQGFDHYDDDLTGAESKALFAFRETTAEDTARRARDWLAERGEQPWFLWVHFFDPHADYEPPAEYLELTQGSRYDGEIAYADAQLGTILDAIAERGELDDTLVAMTSDHGESLGEHGENTHGLFVYDATTRVPLILSHPSLVAGKRVQEVVRTVDVMPTVLELLDVAAGGVLDGSSLADVARRSGARPKTVDAYSEGMVPLYNHGWSDLRALRDAERRYIRAPRAELYEFETDAAELNNLLPEHEDVARPFVQRLARLLPDKEVDSQSVDLADLDPKMRADLEALGYASSVESVDLDSPEERADPKDMIDSWMQTLLGRAMVRNGAYEEGVRVLGEVLEVEPNSVNARAGMATALEKLGHLDRALEQMRALTSIPGNHGRAWIVRATLERKLELDDWRTSVNEALLQSPEDPHIWASLGAFEVEEGRLKEARSAFDKALELDQRHSPAWLGIGSIEEKLGDLEAAEAALNKAVECDPLSSSAWYSFGVLREIQERPEEALEHYQRALDQNPGLVGAWLKLGEIHARQGQSVLAKQEFESALELEPDNYFAHYNLGAELVKSEQFEQALPHFRKACEVAPERAEAWHKLMMVARKQAQISEAFTAAQRLLELEPEHVQALMVCAMSLAEEDESRALQYLRRAVELDRERVETRAQREVTLKGLLDLLSD